MPVQGLRFVLYTGLQTNLELLWEAKEQREKPYIFEWLRSN